MAVSTRKRKCCTKTHIYSNLSVHRAWKNCKTQGRFASGLGGGGDGSCGTSNEHDIFHARASCQSHKPLTCDVG